MITKRQGYDMPCHCYAFPTRLDYLTHEGRKNSLQRYRISTMDTNGYSKKTVR